MTFREMFLNESQTVIEYELKNSDGEVVKAKLKDRATFVEKLHAFADKKPEYAGFKNFNVDNVDKLISFFIKQFTKRFHTISLSFKISRGSMISFRDDHTLYVLLEVITKDKTIYNIFNGKEGAKKVSSKNISVDTPIFSVSIPNAIKIFEKELNGFKIETLNSLNKRQSRNYRGEVVFDRLETFFGVKDKDSLSLYVPMRGETMYSGYTAKISINYIKETIGIVGVFGTVGVKDKFSLESNSTIKDIVDMLKKIDTFVIDYSKNNVVK